MAESACIITEDSIESSLNNGENNDEKQQILHEEHWQSSRNTICERNRYMFMNTLMSDVSLSVGSDQEVSKNIPAHKYVLAISSPVFYAMFYGDLAEMDGTVVIPDTTYECFVEFLRFLYYDEVKLTIDAVMGVSYLAKKYIIPSLEKKCVAFIEHTVDAENVFKLLSLSRAYRDDFVEQICWEFIDNDTLDCIESSMFCEAEKEVVCHLLTRDTLHAKEIELFLALQKWAIAQQHSEEVEDRAEEKNKEKDESKDENEGKDGNEEKDEDNIKDSVKDIVNLVRYPLMSQREFAEHVAKSKLLRHEDVINMFLKFNDTLEDDTVLPFSQVPRRGYYRCALYRDVYGTFDNDNWDLETSKMQNELTFASNSNILLCGVGLYGNDTKGDSYSFCVHVSDEDDQVLLSSEGSFSCHSQCLAYDVIFNKPVKVHKNIWYTIHATVDGPRGVYGGQCLAKETIDLDVDEITCGQVKFLFKDIGSRSHQENMYNHFSGLLYFLH